MNRDSRGGHVMRQPGPSVKDIYITDFRSPDVVRPGEAFEMTVTIGNGAIFRVFDEDDCTHAANDCPGGAVANPAATCLQVEFGVGSVRHRTDPDCLAGTEIGAKERDYSTTFTAPAGEGDIDVSAELVLPGTGSTAGPLRDMMTVSATEPRPPGENGGDPPDGNGGNGGNDNGNGGGGLAELVINNPVKSSIAVLGFGAAFRFLGD